VCNVVCRGSAQTKSKRQIEKISTEDSVSQVIDHLYKVSALALVDADGKLVGDLSADSLRTLSVHNFKRIYLPALSLGDTVCVNTHNTHNTQHTQALPPHHLMDWVNRTTSNSVPTRCSTR
jgi:hypothetical protein